MRSSLPPPLSPAPPSPPSRYGRISAPAVATYHDTKLAPSLSLSFLAMEQQSICANFVRSYLSSPTAVRNRARLPRQLFALDVAAAAALIGVAVARCAACVGVELEALAATALLLYANLLNVLLPFKFVGFLVPPGPSDGLWFLGRHCLVESIRGDQRFKFQIWQASA